MSDQEVERITEVYAARARRLGPEFYSLWKPGNLYRAQRRERGILAALTGIGWTTLRDRTVLDVGCGSGEDLRQLMRYGARPEHLVGVDVQESRLANARDLAPHVRFELIDGGGLPFADGSFDLVMQSTVFSSILDPQRQQALADEMRRVLKPGGYVLWYDMRVTDPRNRDLVPLNRERIAALFPGAELRLRSHTLIPALSRRLAPFGWGLCRALEGLPLLRGHYLGVIRPDGTARP